MAIVKGNFLGNLSGKLGNLSARTVYGRTVLAARPSSFNVSHTPDSIAVRQKFAVNANFSKNVLSITLLKSIWDKNKPQNISVFNAIFKNNYQFTSVDRPTDQNILTPGGFTLPVTSAEIDLNNVSIVLTEFNGATIIGASEVDVAFAALIVLFNPISAEDTPFSIITLYQEVAAFDFANPYNLNMKLHLSEVAEVEKYNNNILLCAAATKDDNSEVVQYSKTFAQES